MKNTIYKNLLLLFITLSLCSNILAKEHTHLPRQAVERIHVHLQKNVYIAGEAVQFKLYCTNAKTQKLSEISRVAYVELVGENGFPVVQNDVILNNGIGTGGFIISDQLPTGNYAINAYTQWMNRTSKELINVTPLFVFNNQNIPQECHNSIITNKSNIQFRDLKNNEINLNNYNETIYNGNEISINSKIEDLNRILKLTLSKNTVTNNDSCLFQLYSREGKVLENKFQFINNNWELLIPIKELKSPNYGICIRDSQNKLVKSSVIHLAKLQRGQLIENPLITTSTRKKININLQLNNLSRESNTLYLSASVKLKEPYNSSVNIIEYQNLHTDFGASMLPYYKEFSELAQKNWIAENGINSIWMSTDTSYSQTADRYSESDAYILEGQVTEIKSKETFANQNIFMSKIGAFADINTFCTNNKGQFFFKLPLKKGLHDISIQVVGKDDLDLTIKLKEKFNKEGIAPFSLNLNQLKGEQLTYIKQLYENFRIRNIYNQKTFKKTKDTCLYRAEQNFFGKPKYSIRISNYIKLDSLEEYFYEFIPNVKIKYKSRKPYMNIFSSDINHVFQQTPLLMYDGLILSDASTILNKDSREIEKIEVVPFEYYYGSAHMYGIVNVISKTQNCELNELPKNTERYYLPLFTNGIEFLNYKIPQQGSQADFRTDLLWEPNIKITKDQNFNLEFTSSDVKGEYELLVEGISENGEPIVLKQSIVVE